ncbi:MAG: peptidyl-prolyl cis-trans isomerase [Candidatus Omnitrophica bacterium]|nr:peptidyl-prolyl cis-trans isomerase [Candidatus Omnitrophota bacterium]
MYLNKKFMGRYHVVVFLCLLGALTGCDKIAALYDKSTSKQSTPQTSSQKSASSTTNNASTTTVNPKADQKPSSSALPSNILASVDSWSISVEDFNEKLTKLKEILPEFDPKDINSKKLILEELIRQELLVKDAEQAGLANQKELKETVEDFRKTLLVQEVATQLTKDIKVTEDEAKEYYDKNKENFVVKNEWKVREIMVPTESEAKDILVQLLQGANFTEIAKLKSKSSSSSKGGDLGWISKFPFEQMSASVTALETGKTSGVFKGPAGYYIVKLDEKRGGSPRPFLSIKNDLIKSLTLQKQQEVVLDHLNKLAAKTNIKINEELLK